jgi:hypothetical protein
MREEYFLIQQLIGFGYWSERYQEFKGFAFATSYSNHHDVLSAIAQFEEPCQIIKVYKTVYK